jgi:hypothetical protein
MGCDVEAKRTLVLFAFTLRFESIIARYSKVLPPVPSVFQSKRSWETEFYRYRCAVRDLSIENVDGEPN